MTKKPQEPIRDTRDKLTLYVTLMVSTTLCISVLAMVVSFMLGLWAKEVDNAEIFKMISPAFSTLIGGMIGFLSGIKLMQNDDSKKSEAPCKEK
jgi:Na+/H+-translocating membrane pyrophosphatase